MLRPALLALLALSSCVTADYDRFKRFEPLADSSWAALVPGESSLADCLAELGAPLRVWEPRPGALALAWVWVDRAGWGLSASVPGQYAYTRWDRRFMHLAAPVHRHHWSGGR